MYETENEEPLVTYNPVINYLSYFNLFECGNHLLYKIDATCEQARMSTSRDKYYTEMYKTLTGYNDQNNATIE